MSLSLSFWFFFSLAVETRELKEKIKGGRRSSSSLTDRYRLAIDPLRLPISDVTLHSNRMVSRRRSSCRLESISGFLTTPIEYPQKKINIKKSNQMGKRFSPFGCVYLVNFYFLFSFLFAMLLSSSLYSSRVCVCRPSREVSSSGQEDDNKPEGLTKKGRGGNKKKQACERCQLGRCGSCSAYSQRFRVLPCYPPSTSWCPAAPAPFQYVASTRAELTVICFVFLLFCVLLSFYFYSVGWREVESLSLSS